MKPMLLFWVTAFLLSAGCVAGTLVTPDNTLKIAGPRLPGTNDTVTYALENFGETSGSAVAWTIWDAENNKINIPRAIPRNGVVQIDINQLTGSHPYTLEAAITQDGITQKKVIYFLPVSFTHISSGTLLMGTDDRSAKGKGNGGLTFMYKGAPVDYELADIRNALNKGEKVFNEAMLLDELPEHAVAVDAFEMMVFEATQEQYALFLNETNHRMPRWPESMPKKVTEPLTLFGKWQVNSDGKRLPATGEENFPVNLISYTDCVAFANWAGYRIPTEAEWEWAASGPQDYKYPWGNTYEENAANIDTHSGPEPVGTRPLDVSTFGVYDLAGNVMEFVNADYASYPGSTQPFDDNRFIIVRGGSWGYPGKDQYNYSRYPFPVIGEFWSVGHDAGCRLARDVPRE